MHLTMVIQQVKSHWRGLVLLDMTKDASGEWLVSSGRSHLRFSKWRADRLISCLKIGNPCLLVSQERSTMDRRSFKLERRVKETLFSNLKRLEVEEILETTLFKFKMMKEKFLMYKVTNSSRDHFWLLIWFKINPQLKSGNSHLIKAKLWFLIPLDPGA